MLSPHSFSNFHPSPFVQNVNANPRPTAQDLAGFWDLLQLSIEDISLKFDELYHLKSNDWQPVPSVGAQSPPDRKVLPTPAAQCPGWGRKAAETGLSPPTTTTISPTLFFIAPLSTPLIPVWDRERASCPVQRGQRDSFMHAWRISSQTGLLWFEHACVTYQYACCTRVWPRCTESCDEMQSCFCSFSFFLSLCFLCLCACMCV